jgi:AraC-like DNA-binding protein
VDPIPRIELELNERPRIAQTGTSLHGIRATESACLHGLWSLHAYHYSGVMRAGGGAYSFHAGWVSLIPPEWPTEWRFPSHAPHHYVHFAVEPPGQAAIRLPLLQDLGDGFGGFSAALDQMIQYHRHDPLRASVRLWDLLHQLRGEPEIPAEEGQQHTSVQKALAIIRNEPPGTINIGRIADIMGVSRNHLTQVFKESLGCGPKQYILRERLERACHLLAHSSLGIKSIALETGSPSMQDFNKLVRKATGLSPSAYRKAARMPPAENLPPAGLKTINPR